MELRVMLTLAAVMGTLLGCPRLVTSTSLIPGSRNVGEACRADDECGTGFCKNRVCCRTECGVEQSCALDGFEGTCLDRRPGDRCARDVNCPSGVCRERMCCDRACDGTESCTLPRAPGLCTTRELGDPCASDAECQSGACVDGVCCNERCGTCRTCNAPGSAGVCTLVPDNTDPDGDCAAEACLACFGGFCLPALPGTDPQGTCAPGQACDSLRTCRSAPGSACTEATGCAAGDCMADVCLRTEQVSVIPTEERLLPGVRRVHDVTQDASGVPVMLLVDRLEGLTGDRVVVTRKGTEGWTRAVLARDVLPFDYGRVVTVGSWTLVGFLERRRNFDDPAATTAPTCRDPRGFMPCGLSGTWVGPDGSVGATDMVAAGFKPEEVPTIIWFDLAARDTGHVAFVAAMGEDHPATLTVYERDPVSGAYRRRNVANDNASPGAAVYAQGTLTVFDTAGGQLRALALVDDTTVQSSSVASPCAPSELFATVVDASGMVHLTSMCEENELRNTFLHAVYNPAAPPTERLTQVTLTDIQDEVGPLLGVFGAYPATVAGGANPVILQGGAYNYVAWQDATRTWRLQRAVSPPLGVEDFTRALVVDVHTLPDGRRFPVAAWSIDYANGQSDVLFTQFLP
ncbi:MAG: hypothetical protein AB2A00_18890 [Myxococcota bacterium]